SGISSLPTAHAPGYPDGPALVCMNDASNPITLPQGCPSTPFTFSGPFPSTPQVLPTQIRVGVYVNGTGALNGFDVTLLTTHLVLRPSGVDLTGSVLVSPFTIIVECLSAGLGARAVGAATGTVETRHVPLAPRLEDQLARLLRLLPPLKTVFRVSTALTMLSSAQ